MTTQTVSRAEEKTSDTRPDPPRRSALGRIGNVLLWVASVVGAVCIALVLAGLFFKVSLVLFKTGSMSPTIPTGAMAVVREIPASEIHVGDVVTVARPQALPVTHRVTGIVSEDSSAGTVTFTMQGDANATEDIEPYTAKTVRLVLWSVPGVASVLMWFSNPFVLGGITLAATSLVLWAFWPRRGAQPPASTGAGGTRRGRHAAAESDSAGVPGRGSMVAAAAIGSTAFLVVGPWAAPAGATAPTIVEYGHYLVLESDVPESGVLVLEEGADSAFQVGVSAQGTPEVLPVEVGVSTNGALEDAARDVTVSISECTVRWDGDRCPGTRRTLVDGAWAGDVAPTGEVRPLITMTSDDSRWVRISARFADSVDINRVEGETLAVSIHASMTGDSAVAGGPVPPELAGTGSDPYAALAVAAVIAASGAGVLAVAKRKYAAEASQ